MNTSYYRHLHIKRESSVRHKTTEILLFNLLILHNNVHQNYFEKTQLHHCYQIIFIKSNEDLPTISRKMKILLYVIFMLIKAYTVP